MINKDLPLHDQTILITGASSGFGKAIAYLLHANGARIIICGRREDRLKAISEELGARVHCLAFDVQQKQSVIDAIKSLPTEFANIDVLVNNAGLALGRLDLAQQAKLEDWEPTVQTNINGLLYCTHSILPMMVERNSGYIINLGSVAGSYAYPGGNVYAASKAFVNHFSANLRADLFGSDIRVTSIEPGIAETEFSVVRFNGDKEKANVVYQDTTPLYADDIAESVLWCLTRPKHVNINKIEIMPTVQTFGPLKISRKDK